MENNVWFIESNGKRRSGVYVDCAWCGAWFISPAKRIRKCCSVECKHNLQRNKIEVNCAWCGNTIEKQSSKLGNSKSGLYFCNRECKDNAQRIGGIREIMPSHYGTSRSYKNLIKETESPKCISCPENKRYLLCVHHIDGNHENDEISNIEIVCWNCHVKRHLKFVDGEWIYSPHELTSRHFLDNL
jgi:hypothetical protein